MYQIVTEQCFVIIVKKWHRLQRKVNLIAKCMQVIPIITFNFVDEVVISNPVPLNVEMLISDIFAREQIWNQTYGLTTPQLWDEISRKHNLSGNINSFFTSSLCSNLW